MKYALALFGLTIAHEYAYYWLPGVPVRVYSAFGGLHMLALAIACLYLLFHRLTDWKVSVVILASLVITVIESALVAVCGSWYAFIYTGPPIFIDKCDAMTGNTLGKPLAYTFATLSLLIMPRIWNKKWPTRQSGKSLTRKSLS